MNRLEAALVHLNTKMENHTDDDLFIECGSAKIKVRGTLVSAAPIVQANGIKTTSNKHKILVVTQILKDKQIKLVRGMRVHRGRQIYEIIIDNEGVQSPEEQYDKRTVVTAKLLSF